MEAQEINQLIQRGQRYVFLLNRQLRKKRPR